jgi:hypothetical protein
MKSKYLILLTSLLLGCTNNSSFKDPELSTEKVVQHASYLQKELNNQGFGITFVKPGEIPNRFIVDVKINSYPGKLVLNTGADASYIGEQYLDQFQLSKYLYKKGKRLSDKVNNGSKEISKDIFIAKAKSLSVGNLNFQPWNFSIKLDRQKGIQGVLGSSYLKLMSSVLSFRTGALLSHPKGKQAKNIGTELKKLGYTEIDISMGLNASLQPKQLNIKMKGNQLVQAGAFLVPVSFDGINSAAAIATEYQFSTIDYCLLQRNNLLSYGAVSQLNDIYYGKRKSKSRSIKKVCSSNFCIGDFCIKNKTCPIVFEHNYTKLFSR